MEANFNYKEVPQGYLHCLNAQCPRSADCLRFKIGTIVDKETLYFTIVNPAYQPDTDKCRFFRPDQLTRHPIGITHLFDNLPHKTAQNLWKTIHKHIGNSVYYRIRDKERAIRPEEEAFIRQAFIEEGITEEPCFDEYIEQYDFFS